MPNFTVKKIHHKHIHKKEIQNELPKIEKTKRSTRKFIFISLILLSLIFGINYIVQGIGNMKVGTAGNTNIPFTTIKFNSSTETGTIVPEKKGVTNILIVGIGGAGHQAGELADSIMLASFNEESKNVTMISVPRDLYVNYGTNEGAGKINALYPIGLGQKVGISLLANKVSEVTGQSIHHYIVIDFTAFRYIVDALGGVEIDVIKDLYDREYPDYNYGYTIFSVKKGLQVFNGETALRYARSRHSTSDMDRSRRQQQIINAIKTKALSAGIITSPSKISEIIDATRKNIDTDLTVGDIVSIGSTFANIEKSAIHVYNLGSDCIAYNNCSIGSYLYNPSMAYFGGAWTVIPEGARINKLSYYDRIHRFVNFVFEFPGLNITEQPIVVIHNNASLSYAKNLLMEMRKIGVNFENNHVLNSSTGIIEQSHINVYWNEEYDIGINPESSIIKALKSLDMRIPINIVTGNEYIKTNGPKIEIVLGNDYKNYFTFSKPAEYLPKIENPTNTGEVVSGEKNKKITPNTKNPPEKTPQKIDTSVQNINNTPVFKVIPGEWEDL
ncbi:LCP family protein [Candidatus Gracilibacteria bacterium]|nr:LCP family protein [Candidatus Gracilibacteria bacterium]